MKWVGQKGKKKQQHYNIDPSTSQQHVISYPFTKNHNDHSHLL